MCACVSVLVHVGLQMAFVHDEGLSARMRWEWELSRSGSRESRCRVHVQVSGPVTTHLILVRSRVWHPTIPTASRSFKGFLPAHGWAALSSQGSPLLYSNRDGPSKREAAGVP